MSSPIPFSTAKPEESKITTPLLWVGALSGLVLFGSWLPTFKFFAIPAHYLPLHITLEFVAIAVSAMVFALAWNLRSARGNSHAIILGSGFLAAAFPATASGAITSVCSSNSPQYLLTAVAALTRISASRVPSQRASEAYLPDIRPNSRWSIPATHLGSNAGSC